MAFFKKEKNEKKKGVESTIGKIIYGFLLFAPLLVITTTSLYTIFNKNAFESYSGSTTQLLDYQVNYKYETNEVSSVDDLVIGNIYHFEDTIPNDTATIFLSNLFNLNISTDNNDYVSIISVTDLYSLSYNQNYFTIRYLNNTNLFTLAKTSIGTFLNFSVDFVCDANTLTLNNYYISKISSSDYNVIESITADYEEVSYLDNNFEYGCYKAENSTLFNWAKNTGTYTVLETTTTGLGITNTFVPFLMAYWLLISVIYFIFDIALILIWMVHDKIHELKDSI